MSHSRRAVRCGSGGGARVPVEEGVGEGDRESLGQNVAEGVGQATREGTFCAYHSCLARPRHFGTLFRDREAHFQCHGHTNQARL